MKYRLILCQRGRGSGWLKLEDGVNMHVDRKSTVLFAETAADFVSSSLLV